MGTGESTVNKQTWATNRGLGLERLLGQILPGLPYIGHVKDLGLYSKCQVDEFTYEVESIRLGEGLKIIFSKVTLPRG